MKGRSPLFENYIVSRRNEKGNGSASGTSISLSSSLAPFASESKPKNALPDSGRKNVKKNKRPIFTKKGHVTIQSIAARREFFLGKSVARMEHELRKHGYEVTRKSSKHKSSKAKIVLTLNPSKDRNIKQIQISPGSSRHGDVPYVKISTSDYGKIKIVGADRQAYKTDGHETATILFRRKMK